MLIRLALVFLLSLTAHAGNWPQWRGPTGDGLSQEANVAVRWSATENVLWKTPLKGLGTSTPIVWEDRIFLTSQIGDGPSAGGQDFEETQSAKSAGSGVTFLVQAFARDGGGLLWEKRFQAEDSLPEVHVKHNLASPSCVTDGERVYAWFGTGLAVALSLDGELLWKRSASRSRALTLRCSLGPWQLSGTLQQLSFVVGRSPGRGLLARPRQTERQGSLACRPRQ